MHEDQENRMTHPIPNIASTRDPKANFNQSFESSQNI